jgi:hypothetical protein
MYIREIRWSPQREIYETAVVRSKLFLAFSIGLHYTEQGILTCKPELFITTAVRMLNAA